MARKILEVLDLRASVSDRKDFDDHRGGLIKNDKPREDEILKGVDFSILENETAVLLGPNGAGKSTVAGAIMGDPRFKTSGKIKFLEKYDLLKLSPNKRAKLGIFLSFQNPIDIPGISTTEMLREALMNKLGRRVTLDETREKVSETRKKLRKDNWFLERELNVGFSGGEKKVNEILQMVALEPKLVILDEIDSGLDIDAAENISEILADYQKESKCSYLIITHNMRILKKLEVDKTILLRDGRVYKAGDAGLLKRVEKNGFRAVFDEISEDAK